MQEVVTRECKKHGSTPHRLENNSFYRCKKCKVEHVSNSRRKRKAELVELFGGCCQICGYNKSVRALHFHHINPEDKSFEISTEGYSLSKEKVIEEAKKCVLLCSNCHCEVEEGLIELPKNIKSKVLV